MLSQVSMQFISELTEVAVIFGVIVCRCCVRCGVAVVGILCDFVNGGYEKR